MEEKKKRGRPKKKQTLELPEEIQKLVDDTIKKEHEEFEEIKQEVTKEIKSKDKWDVKKDDPILFFDKRLSYEITGYRPITETEGLDFNPDWFTETRTTYLNTKHYTSYRMGTKAYSEFWNEQYKRCRDGMTVNGYTITGPHYYYLNFYQLPNIDVEKAGSGRAAIFPRFLVFQYEFFHYFEICRILKKDCCLMKARGIGFSEINASICACIYNCFSESRCMISTQAKNYLDKSLDKVWGALDFANEHTDGGLAKLTQGKNTQYLKRASVKTTDQNGIETETGWMSEIEGVVADTDAKIRGDRVDLLVYEEAGSNPVLRKSYIKGKALIYIGGSKFGIRMVGGTGGDRGVALADLKEIYEDPKSFDVLPFYHNYTPSGEWVYTGYFIPSYIAAVTSYGVDANGIRRQIIDDRGFCLSKNYKEQLDADRNNITNPKALVDHCAEYCYTAEEAFALEGENKFNKVLITEQLTKIRVLQKGRPIDTGYFTFQYKNGKPAVVKGQNVDNVVWHSDNKIQRVKIVEHPVWTQLYQESEKERIKKLQESGEDIDAFVPEDKQNARYVIGVDGIDIGQEQTSDLTKDPSKFCAVVLKRVSGMKDPCIVALYKDRPDRIKEAYQTVIALALYYNALINIEATRVSFLGWSRENYFLNWFMKRPKMTYPDITKQKSTQYGSPATKMVIEHHTDLTRDYVDDYCHTIWFTEVLDELLGYSDEKKRKFDIVAALGHALLADEELQGITPKSVQQNDNEFEDIGYYIDENGYKRFGVIPNKNKTKLQYNPNYYDDDTGTIRTSNPRIYYQGDW